MDFLNQVSTWKESAGRTHNAVINGAQQDVTNSGDVRRVRLITLLCGGDEVTEASNVGCRSCRYYLQTSSECLKENRRGELMRKGLAGMCSQFKEIEIPYPEGCKLCNVASGCDGSCY